MNDMATQSLVTAIEFLFGGDTPQPPLQLYQVAARAAVVYLAGIVIVRWGKSRLIGRTTAIDVLLGFILGSLLSRGITGHASISGTLVSSATIVAVHYLISRLALGSRTFETWLKGHAILLVRDGICDRANMRNSHISSSDLEEQLRLNGAGAVEQVHRASKERNGEVSVIKVATVSVVEVKVEQGVQVIRVELHSS